MAYTTPPRRGFRQPSGVQTARNLRRCFWATDLSTTIGEAAEAVTIFGTIHRTILGVEVAISRIGAGLGLRVLVLLLTLLLGPGPGLGPGLGLGLGLRLVALLLAGDRFTNRRQAPW